MKTRIQEFFIALALYSTLNFHPSTVSAQPVIVAKVPIPAGLGGLAVNPSLNKIYLSGQGAQPVEIDGVTFSQTNIGIIGDGLDVDLENNNFWLAGLYAGAATLWNSANAEIASIPLGYCPTGVNVDSVHRRAWVSAQCGGGNDPVWAIDADTYAVIGGPIGSGGIQGATQVNPATGRFYIDPSSVSKRVNPINFAATVNPFGVVLGVNATSNLLYAMAENNTLQIIDGAPDMEVILASVTLPFGSGSFLGVNPVLNRVYVGSSSSNLIAVVDGRSGQAVETISLDSEITRVGNIVVDASRSRVYALAYSPSSAQLFVIEDAPPPMPDLQVVNISTRNNRAPEGAKVTLTATVMNAGNADAGPSTTAFMDGAALIGLAATPAISARARVSVSVDWFSAARNGDHILSATANARIVAPESNYDNNTAAITINVLGNQVR